MSMKSKTQGVIKRIKCWLRLSGGASRSQGMILLVVAMMLLMISMVCQSCLEQLKLEHRSAYYFKKTVLNSD